MACNAGDALSQLSVSRGVGGSNDEALNFEPINCRGNGPAGQVDAAADRVHGLLTPVEE